MEKRTITNTLFEKGKAYRNTDPYRGQVNTLIHPFRVAFSVDLVGGQDNMTTKKYKYDKKHVIYLDTKDQCEFGHEKIYQSERMYK